MTDHTEFFVESGKASELMQEFALAKECTDMLQNHYPGYMWAVNINTEGGIAVVKNIDISQNYGYVIHLINLLNDPKRRKIVEAGGEILERAAMARKYRGDKVKYVEGLAARHQPIAR